jgi:hypothetical protein
MNFLVIWKYCGKTCITITLQASPKIPKSKDNAKNRKSKENKYTDIPNDDKTPYFAYC